MAPVAQPSSHGGAQGGQPSSSTVQTGDINVNVALDQVGNSLAAEQEQWAKQRNRMDLEQQTEGDEFFLNAKATVEQLQRDYAEYKKVTAAQVSGGQSGGEQGR